MGTTASLHPAVDSAAVWSRLPPRYRTDVSIAALGADPIDLLVFGSDQRHVVTLDDVARALSGIDRPSMRLVAIGYDFTEEARSRISSLGGLIFPQRG